MMSLSSTCKNTPSTSPKSPPNSPNVELADFKDLKEQLRKQGVFINREPEPTMDDILNQSDWRSRPNMLPPRNWKLAGVSSSNSSGSSSVKNECRQRDWTGDIMLTMLGTNVMSLVIGIGFGYWVYRKSSSWSSEKKYFCFCCDPDTWFITNLENKTSWLLILCEKYSPMISNRPSETKVGYTKRILFHNVCIFV